MTQFEHEWQDLATGLEQLQTVYLGYEEDLEDLAFDMRNRALGKESPLRLNIDGARLRINQREEEVTMIEQVAQFIHILYEKLGDADKASVNGELMERVAAIASNIRTGIRDRIEPLVPEIGKLRWRDVNVEIVRIKHAFRGEQLGAGMTKLRQIIHRRELGQEDYTLEHEDIHLDIKKEDSDEVMLQKLATFSRAIQRKCDEKFPEPMEREVEQFPSSAVYWTEVATGFMQLKEQFRGSDLGAEFSSLKNLIDSERIKEAGYHIETEWATLQIEPDTPYYQMADQIAEFVEIVQKGNPDKFPEPFTVAEAKKALDAQKFHWRDAIAAIDHLQSSAYPANEYPALQELKARMEAGTLGVDSDMAIYIGPIRLNIKKTNSDTDIQHKVAVFIGELKQVVPDEKTSTTEPLDPKLDQTFWRDIEAALISLEDVYGTNKTFRKLVFFIKEGILGANDFTANVGGHTLEIKSTDSDLEMRDKLNTFIRELNEGRIVELDRKAMERIQELERNQIELEEEYRRQTQRARLEFEEQRQTARRVTEQKEQSIEQLENELRRVRMRPTPAPRPAPVRPVRSYSG